MWILVSIGMIGLKGFTEGFIPITVYILHYIILNVMISFQSGKLVLEYTALQPHSFIYEP